MCVFFFSPALPCCSRLPRPKQTPRNCQDSGGQSNGHCALAMRTHDVCGATVVGRVTFDAQGPAKHDIVEEVFCISLVSFYRPLSLSPSVRPPRLPRTSLLPLHSSLIENRMCGCGSLWKVKLICKGPGTPRRHGVGKCDARKSHLFLSTSLISSCPFFLPPL